MNNAKIKKTITLLVVDGLGVAPASEGNAISKAKMPFLKELLSRYPATTISPVAKKKINLGNNYFIMGTGDLCAKKNSSSFLDILTNHEKKWLIITETEKYAESVFFFPGKKKIKKDNYILTKISAAEDYALKPELATPKISEETIKAIKSRRYNFIFSSLANLDVVSRLGNFSAAKEAAEIIDHYLKKIAKAALENEGILIISAAAGKAEDIINMKTEVINKNSTLNPVPFIIIGREFEGKTIGLNEAPGGELSLLKPAGTLADIAPTILKIMGLPAALNMTGKSLI